MARIPTAAIEPRNYKWTTGDEIDFLKRLGEHKPMPNGLPRRQLLVGYVQAMRRRTYWGLVDREVIESYINLELAGR